MNDTIDADIEVDGLNLKAFHKIDNANFAGAVLALLNYARPQPERDGPRSSLKSPAKEKDHG